MRPRSLAPLLMLVVPALLSSCGTTPNPARPTATPTDAPRPSAPAPPPRASVEPGPARATAGPALRTDPAPVAAPERIELIVASVGDQPVGATELMLRWLAQNPLEVREILGQVVVSRLVALEAKRLGVRVQPDLVEGQFLELLEDLELKIQGSEPGLSMDEWIVKRLGLPPEFYLAQAEADVVRGLLAERVVRAFGMSQERAAMRAIVTNEREEAEEALRRAQAGEDFGDLARELSADASAQRGGQLPPIPRSQSQLSRLAFQTGAGNLGGPVQEQGGWIVLEVQEIHPPVKGTWAEVRDEVEASLARSPVQDLEFLQWKAAMEERYRVDTGALLDLIEGDGRP